MDFEFSSDSVMLRDMVRRFVQKEVRPLEMEFFNHGSIDGARQERLRAALDQMGLWGITVPEQFGGGGLDVVSSCLLDEELGSTFLPVEIGEVTPLLFDCRGGQVQHYLQPALAARRKAFIAAREPGGLDPERWQTQAIQRADGWEVSGRKEVAGVPAPRDFWILFARSAAGPTAFLVDADSAGLDLLSGKAPLLDLHRAVLPAGSILGSEGNAFQLARPYAPIAWIRTGARYLGMVSRLLEMACEHARDWVALGGPLSVRRAVRRMLAETQVDLESCRWLVYHAAWMADRGLAIRVAASQVRLGTGEMLRRAVDRTTMVFAGAGPSPQIEINRFVRSAAPAAALDWALDQAREAIAAAMLQWPAEGGRE
ncbi:MAG: acyl-CoA dehydrogenase family protein [Anaerolineales bacterium]|jgi:acyl-CoA dehydrogenase